MLNMQLLRKRFEANFSEQLVDQAIKSVKTAPKKRVGDVELLIQTGSGDREFEGSKRRLNTCFSRGKTPRQCV